MLIRSHALLAGAMFSIVPGAHSASHCDDFIARLPNVQRAICEAAGLQASSARSVQGRTIWVRDIKPDNPTLRVLVVGGIHGDEPSATSVALRWIGLARQAPSDTPQVVHWRFIPALKPDGLFNQPPRRVNASGVDLNRNFPHPAGSATQRPTEKGAPARTRAATPARIRCQSRNRVFCMSRWSASSRN